MVEWNGLLGHPIENRERVPILFMNQAVQPCLKVPYPTLGTSSPMYFLFGSTYNLLGRITESFDLGRENVIQIERVELITFVMGPGLMGLRRLGPVWSKGLNFEFFPG